MTDGIPEIRVDIKIAKASEDIIACLFEIEKSCFSSPWTEQMLRDSLLSENVLALTAQENGVTVGYAMAFASGDEADIVNLAVMPEYRRRGIGRALLQMLLWHLRQAGVKSSFLEVRSSNEKAKELYISEGFSEIGVRRNYYNKPKENALVMFSDLTK